MQYLCSVATSRILSRIAHHLGLLSCTWSTFLTKGVPASKILKKWPSSWSTQLLPTFEQPCHRPSVPGSPWAAISDWTIFIAHETAREWEMCTMEFNCLSVLFFLKQKNVVFGIYNACQAWYDLSIGYPGQLSMERWSYKGIWHSTMLRWWWSSPPATNSIYRGFLSAVGLIFIVPLVCQYIIKMRDQLTGKTLCKAPHIIYHRAIMEKLNTSRLEINIFVGGCILCDKGLLGNWLNWLVMSGESQNWLELVWSC